jgi:hypothetical protein
MDCGAPKEGTRLEGTGFSDLERSAVPDLVAGLSQTSEVRADLVGGLLMSILRLRYKGVVTLVVYISRNSNRSWDRVWR